MNKQLEKKINESKAKIDAFAMSVVEKELLPEVKKLWEKLKSRNFKNGVRLVDGMGETFIRGVGSHSIGTDRLYQWLYRNPKAASRFFPEIDELYELLAILGDDFNYSLGNLE